MRADRLLALLMILQTRGKVNARSLARELEVSERTVYRDIEALSAAGVPVYAERGPGGGCALLENYRTNLTGLTAEETRALFMLSIPAPLDQLGVTQELKAALLKLTAALPESRRAEQTRSRERIHLDSHWWFQPPEAAPTLPLLHEAAWKDTRLRIRHRSFYGAEVEHTVDPLGLVAKAGVWYLVGRREQGDLRAFRVGRIVQVDVLPERFSRPAQFDLAAFWKDWCAEFEAARNLFHVRVRLSPAMFAVLQKAQGERAVGLQPEDTPPDPDGWRTAVLFFETFELARERILAMGGAAEVLEPQALRKSVCDYARQVLGRYPQQTT